MMGSDPEVAEFVAGVEQAAVTVYRDAIASQRLDGAAAAVCDLFAGHHREHAAVFSDLAGRGADPGSAHDGVRKDGTLPAVGRAGVAAARGRPPRG